MLLVLVGGVMTVQAKDWVVVGNAAIINGTTEWNTSIVDNKLIQIDDTHFYLIIDGCTLTASSSNNYSFKIAEYKADASWGERYPGNGEGDNYTFRVSSDGDYTLIYTFETTNHSIGVIPVKKMTLSNNYNGANTWDSDNSSYYLTRVSNTAKWTIDLPSAEGASDWYFRIFNSGVLGWLGDEGKTKLQPSESDQLLTLGGQSDETELRSDTKSWKIEYPSYDFDHFTITAEYNLVNRKWEVSADAYISKTLAYVENTYIGTFGSAANVDFSNVEGLTAKKLKVSAGTIIETNATTLFGGEGALLTAESAGPFSIPVASSASADTDNNDLVAITEKVQLAQEPVTGYTAYVLTNKKADGSEGSLAFYKVNSSGTWCAAGTAYLKVAKVGGAPDYIPFGETTGIENVSHEAVINNQYYTLDGRRVAQPTKGLYIVNGKKVIIK